MNAEGSDADSPLGLVPESVRIIRPCRAIQLQQFSNVARNLGSTCSPVVQRPNNFRQSLNKEMGNNCQLGVVVRREKSGTVENHVSFKPNREQIL